MSLLGIDPQHSHAQIRAFIFWASAGLVCKVFLYDRLHNRKRISAPVLKLIHQQINLSFLLAQATQHTAVAMHHPNSRCTAKEIEHRIDHLGATRRQPSPPPDDRGCDCDEYSGSKAADDRGKHNCRKIRNEGKDVAINPIQTVSHECCRSETNGRKRIGLQGFRWQSLAPEFGQSIL